MGSCGGGGVSGEVESEMWEGGGGGSTGYGADIVMGVGKYEEETRVGQGVTCEYIVGGTAVAAAPDGGRNAGWIVGGG